MNTKKEMTAPITSVGADEEQSNSIKTNTIITDYDENCNASDDIFLRCCIKADAVGAEVLKSKYFNSSTLL